MNDAIGSGCKHVLVLFVLASLISCATINVNSIAAPSPTSKLRVYVQPLTGEGRWSIPHDAYVQSQVVHVQRFLESTGIYEVVGEREVRSVIGNQHIERWQLQRNEWALARRIGKALHADYVMVMERIMQRGTVGGRDFQFVNIMINVATGKVFESRTLLADTKPEDREEKREQIRTTYRNIFRSSKQDMLATAISKGRNWPLPSAPKPVSIPTPGKSGDIGTSQKTPPPIPFPEQIPASTIPGLTERLATGAGAKKLIVYDFDATEQYRTVALILAEALREEVFKLKQFVLVNREDLHKVLEEMALQQTGLIDEKEAVRTGKGLAAHQVVTGRLNLLGKVFVMQAKRVDVETFGTLGLASITFSEGQEIEALNKLPDFAKSLAGLQ